MKITHLRRLSLLFLGGCAGCASAPVHYHTLSAPAATSVAGHGATMTIEVGVVRLPAELNRSELMVRSGPTEVTLLENERWASPLSDEIQEAVQLELRNRARGAPDSAPWRAAGKMFVTLNVERLEAQFDRSVALEATWSAKVTLDKPNETIVRSCRFRALDAIGGGYAGIVQGYQRELTALAAAIISELDSPEDLRGQCREPEGVAQALRQHTQ
jgi:uncharacterized protein